MAINTLAYSQIFQTELDKQMLATATSSWMDANAGQVKYNGGDTVKIPSIALTGLKKYDRELKRGRKGAGASAMVGRECVLYDVH